ncbi:Vesicle-associated protein 1-2 [Cardamine amara subsp. amara]|uniref:Vesicle-associated protein 1-2 n=1 Tax=Cardamine amara subsp. amara TaxID=228776 RepID=A0ABD0Z7D3_CARAN
MQCKDKFLLQCVVTSPGVTAKDVTPEMFSKQTGLRVEETKLRVVYVAPPRPPSPVREGSEEGSSPRASVSDNGTASDFTPAPRFSADRVEAQDNSSEARALITRLTDEKNSALQLNNRLQQELDQLKRESKRSQSGGIPLMYVLLIGIISLILGYIMKRT